jgi:uncharacterized protein YndB with AHSA1/START domain
MADHAESTLGEMFRAPGVRFERRLPGPIEKVWAHLTRPDELPGWYGAGSTIEPREGGKVLLNDGHIRGVVTQWRPLVKFAHTWNVFSAGETVSPYPESYLTVELGGEGAVVALTLVHLPVLERFEPQNAMGWATFLDILEATARGEPVQPRRDYMEKNAALYGVDLANLVR